MKITLSVNDAHSIEVGYVEIEDFISCLGDDPARADFFGELVKHPASQIRAAVAINRCLPLPLLEKLVNDPSIEVVRSVAGNRTALQSFEVDTFRAMIRRDVSVAFELASRQDQINPSARNTVLAELAKHEDQYIRDIVQDIS